MPLRRTAISGSDLAPALQRLRTELEVPADFPAAVTEAAAAAAAQPPRGEFTDATAVSLVTLDPPGAQDLDQAFAITRHGAGFVVHYAIADVAAWVSPGGAVDAEAHARGETLYLPDGRAPLHPPVLSEAAASLLPDGDRPAVLWRFELDADAEPTAVDVRRAMVRSRARLDYPAFQRSGDELARLLRMVGERRQARERERGGVSLPVPEQQVSCVDGTWMLELRAPLPVEGWNAQLSLLTGISAARLMLDAGVGLLRTMPTPPDHVVSSLRRSAKALGVAWPPGAAYAEVVRRLDADVPAQAALLRLAATLFRGAGYVAFDGTPPAQPLQAAVAAPYAHATAPLRRLADRYVSECCLAAAAGNDVPAWVRDALARLPEEMAAADRRAHQVDRAVVDLAEALVLQARVGQVFRGVVVEAGEGRGEVQIADPPVRARLDGDDLPLGHEVDVRLAEADPDQRRVTFTPA